MAWNVDATHSQATFTVKHMMISTVRGLFDVLSGQLNIDEEHPENSWVEAEVDVASINTRDERRDGHLKSPDFFDVENYPKITFKSTKVEPVGDHEYRVTGNLTMHGVTREEVFQVEYSGILPKDLYGMQRAAFTTKTTINRKDYGLNWNVALETGGVLVGEKVNIEIDLTAVRQAPVAETAESQTA
jgi:polyisoprenoid-binding protein YceI